MTFILDWVRTKFFPYIQIMPTESNLTPSPLTNATLMKYCLNQSRTDPTVIMGTVPVKP